MDPHNNDTTNDEDSSDYENDPYLVDLDQNDILEYIRYRREMLESEWRPVTIEELEQRDRDEAMLPQSQRDDHPSDHNRDPFFELDQEVSNLSRYIRFCRLRLAANWHPLTFDGLEERNRDDAMHQNNNSNSECERTESSRSEYEDDINVYSFTDDSDEDDMLIDEPEC